jgi:hypothetical protein
MKVMEVIQINVWFMLYDEVFFFGYYSLNMAIFFTNTKL